MVIVTNNWRLWLAGLAVSLIAFLVLFFAVIKPSSDTANNAVRSGLQQSQQAINDATKQFNNASSQAGGSSTQAGQALSKAAKLTACVSAAGTDLGKIQACQVQYGH
jgi:hypothetical protein